MNTHVLHDGCIYSVLLLCICIATNTILLVIFPYAYMALRMQTLYTIAVNMCILLLL